MADVTLRVGNMYDVALEATLFNIKDETPSVTFKCMRTRITLNEREFWNVRLKIAQGVIEPGDYICTPTDIDPFIIRVNVTGGLEDFDPQNNPSNNLWISFISECEFEIMRLNKRR